MCVRAVRDCCAVTYGLACCLPRIYFALARLRCVARPSSARQTADDYLAVMLARLDYLRRRAAEAIAASVVAKNAVATSFAKLRDAFRTASEFMMSHYPDHVDRYGSTLAST